MRPKVLTWHVHGNYMYYLSHADFDFFLPVGRVSIGYSGKSGDFDWGTNVHEVHVDEIPDLDLDLILFQHKDNYQKDQYDILNDKQRSLPKIFLEHDPPREHPTDTKHAVDDPSMLIVHVTNFNKLMWDNNRTTSVVIDHGVVIPEDISYSGKKAKGIVVINNIESRGRRLGNDIFQQVSQSVPLDLVGMGSREIGGIGELSHRQLPGFVSDYRFFFNPIRYTSLGLSLCEAMMLGLPVVALSTTEVVTVVEDGVSGYISTDLERLIDKMKLLINDSEHAKKLGQNAAAYARQRFSIDRFAKDWERVVTDFLSGH